MRPPQEVAGAAAAVTGSSVPCERFRDFLERALGVDLDDAPRIMIPPPIT
jgi:hypothetical protein